jgi:hypothetical protein
MVIFAPLLTLGFIPLLFYVFNQGFRFQVPRFQHSEAQELKPKNWDPPARPK